MKSITFILIALAISRAISSPVVPNNRHSPMETEGLFEGDILGINGKGIAQVGNVANRWPNGVVPYTFDSNTFTDEQKEKILSGMKLIEDSTRGESGKDCIKFVPRSSQLSYLKIISGSGCYSFFCYPLNLKKIEPQELSLHVPATPQSGHCIHLGTIAHELIHALGFWHEQSRADRDEYVNIHMNNIIAGTEYNFNKYPLESTDPLGEPYDYYSIMHYAWDEFSKNGKATIEAKQPGVELVNPAFKAGLSHIDVNEIRKYYKCA